MFKPCAVLRLGAALLFAAAAPAQATIGAAEAPAQAAATPQLPTPSHGPCASPFDAQAVLHCAFSRSPELRLARQELEVLAGKHTTAATLLPSHPVVTASVADRRIFSPAPQDSPSPVINWYVTLSQEIEVAGQRGARLNAVEAELTAQLRKVAITEQELAAAALSAYYEVLAAEDELRLAAELSHTAQALVTVSAARAKESLVAPVDADVARTEAVNITLGGFEAERRHTAAQALLGALLGMPGPFTVTGSLDQTVTAPAASEVPLELAVHRAFTIRGEVVAAEQERNLRAARVSLLRRQRIPNPTLSFFAQRDGFNERVLGAGISMPLFLPSPLGPSRAGELASARAQLEQADTTIEQARRRIRSEVTRAIQAEQTCARALLLFPPDLIARAKTDLEAITQALSAHQLAIREALLAQRSLIEFQQAYIRSRLAFALARVERLRAMGLPLAGGTP